jgi:hypothetical protein
MTETKSPQCVFEAQPNQLPLAIDFQPRDGLIYGFVYGHLLNYLSEKNPDEYPGSPPSLRPYRLNYSSRSALLRSC